MADYTTAKSGPGGLYPEDATEAAWNRVEPLITPKLLQERHLFGLSLVSGMKDPLTGKAQVYTPELMKDTIDRAVTMVETDTGLTIFPTYIKEKAAFDQAEYLSFGFFQLMHRPAAKIHKIAVSPSTNEDIFIVPPEWIETGRLNKGCVNILPMTAALGTGGFVPAMSAGGAVFLQLLGNKAWLPSFWVIEYTAGFPDGMLPKNVNEIIGVYAACEVLSQLAATYGKSNSHSQSIDGVSQSVSGPGAQIFTQRMQELEAKKKGLVKKLKAEYGQVLFSGNV